MPDFVDSVFDVSSTVFQTSRNLIFKSYDHIRNIWMDSTPPPTPAQHSIIRTSINQVSRLDLKTIFLATVLGGIGTYRCLQHSKTQRRARLLPSGRRFEVVVIVGSPTSVVVQKLVNDLNRRGYIVYVTVTNELEVKAIESERDADIKPLLLNYDSALTIRTSLLRLASILETPELNHTGDDSSSYFLHFKGALIIADYFKYPKYSKLAEIEPRDFNAMIQNQFLKINALLQNGLITALQESNNRRNEIEKYNGVNISECPSKLIFVNFFPISTKEKRRLFLNFTLDINNLLFEYTYKENLKSYCGIPYILHNKNPDYIDIAKLQVDFHQDEESKLLSSGINILNIRNMFSGIRNKKLTSRKFHHQVFDLLNTNYLKKVYTINA
ncbi:hypothetical protein KL942_000655 [Ogataea angusta]|uniref:Uncharacterized protein n=1 Tax=Pichia angusta TaxID=870730 RepID=A0ABQ7S2V9_PICAN|nr:hypothetical protein KL942_000655 [Ogataea angusta]KAG7852288.1 hypothetical protein KL940_001170 [Ogataea angusta]